MYFYRSCYHGCLTFLSFFFSFVVFCFVFHPFRLHFFAVGSHCSWKLMCLNFFIVIIKRAVVIERISLSPIRPCACACICFSLITRCTLDVIFIKKKRIKTDVVLKDFSPVAVNFLCVRIFCKVAKVQSKYYNANYVYLLYEK